MKRLCKDRVTGNVVPPVVESHTPRVRVSIAPKSDKLLCPRRVAEPGRVLGTDRSVGSFDLGVVKDRLAEDEITIRRPDEVVERVVAVLCAEAGEHARLFVSPVVTISVLEKNQVRLIGDIDSVFSDNEGERNVEVFGKNSRLIRFTVLVGVLEDHDLIVGLIAGINVGISG